MSSKNSNAISFFLILILTVIATRTATIAAEIASSRLKKHQIGEALHTSTTAKIDFHQCQRLESTAKTTTTESSKTFTLELPVLILTSPEIDHLTGHLITTLLLNPESITITNSHKSSSSSSSSSFCDLFISSESCFLRKICNEYFRYDKDQKENFQQQIIRIEPCLLVLRGDTIIPSASASSISTRNIYHRALERKMRVLTKAVETFTLLLKLQEIAESQIQQDFETDQQNNTKKNKSMFHHQKDDDHDDVIFSEWFLFIDSDSQVFPGWFKKLIGPHLLFPPPPSSSSSSSKPVLHELLVFQREASAKVGTTHDRINSGVILAHVASPEVKAIFKEANTLFMPKAGGDQTALQRTLKYYAANPENREEMKNLLRKWKLSHSSSSSSCSNPPSSSSSSLAFDYGVFSKFQVNAGLSKGQRQKLLIHHSHMSGKFKREKMKTVFLFKNNQNDDNETSSSSSSSSSSLEKHQQQDQLLAFLNEEKNHLDTGSLAEQVCLKEQIHSITKRACQILFALSRRRSSQDAGDQKKKKKKKSKLLEATTMKPAAQSSDSSSSREDTSSSASVPSSSESSYSAPPHSSPSLDSGSMNFILALPLLIASLCVIIRFVRKSE